MYNIQNDLRKNKTRQDGVYAISKEMMNSPTTIHHSSLEIYISLLWVKTALCIEKKKMYHALGCHKYKSFRKVTRVYHSSLIS